jgi:hypothetical protein
LIGDRPAASPSFHGDVRVTDVPNLLTSSSRAKVNNKVLFRVDVRKVIEKGVDESSRQLRWSCLLQKRKFTRPLSCKHVLATVLNE